MTKIFEAVIDYLEKCGLIKTARIMRKELAYNKGIILDSDKETHLLKLIHKDIEKREKDRKRKKYKQDFENKENKPKRKKTYEKMSNDEVEKVMEDFMNKLFVSPALLEDEKLNYKIEKIFENHVFQKMVENANVLEDAGVISNSQVKDNRHHDRSEEHFDMDKNILDSKLIEKSELLVPYKPSEEEQKRIEEEESKKLEQERIRNEREERLKKEQEEKQKKYEKESEEMKNSPMKAIDVEKIKQESKNFEDHMKNDLDNISNIEDGANVEEKSQFLQEEASFFNSMIEEDNNDDEFKDDDDPGFHLYEVGEDEFARVCQHLAREYNYPEKGVKFGAKKRSTGMETRIEPTEEQKRLGKENGYIYLPENVKHPNYDDSFYPVGHNNTIYDCFSLRVIYDRERTGFEETKEFPIVIGSIIAGRYRIVEYLGSAAFSKAIQCLDLRTGNHYCMKVIENNKDYFDQSIDEIKLLNYINCNGDVDDYNVLRIFDYFYHKEHLFIVTELLKDNLYEYYKFNREKEPEPYFTIGRLQKITKQILTGLKYVHGLKLIHCDLKPENIMIKSYSRSEVKIIDFGSSCYIHDHLSSYVQSRSYRAPEVIIGCKYDYKIDMWSLGCILAELWTGNVLFQNDTVQGLLSRVIGIIGPFPEWMMKEGRLVGKFFTSEKLLYQDVYVDNEASQDFNDVSDHSRHRERTGRLQILVPKQSSLKHRLRTDDVFFLDFVRNLLRIDPHKRFTADEALKHPWLTQAQYDDI